MSRIASELRRLRLTWDVWLTAPLLLAAALLCPLAYVVSGLFAPAGETWRHLASTVFPGYLLNTFLTLTGTGFLALLLGVPCAWLTATYRFPGRRFFEWGLILPLAIPTYICAYAYAGMFDYAGPIQTFLRNRGVQSSAWMPEIMSLPSVVVVMAVVLYPYVFLIVRTAFLGQSAGLIEAARMLGKTPFQSFWQVALPSVRPAVAGSVALVMMEVLNDYGAMKYYGVNTMTTGIFRAWFSLGEPSAALRLAAFLMLFALAVLAFERANRGQARFHNLHGRAVRARPRLKGALAWGAWGVCALPFLLGFALPILQLVYWTGLSGAPSLEPGGEFLKPLASTFGLASVAALLTVGAALILVFSSRIHRGPLMGAVSKLSVLGYSIPGAVIAVGVLMPSTTLDRWIDAASSSLLGRSTGLLITGSLTGLVFAYLVRFLAVTFNPVQSGFEKICGSLDDASRSLGASRLRTLFRIDLPLLRATLIGGAILVFVDVVKELPLTLILRPFDFETLSTKVFEMAGDERVSESAHLSLVIVLTSLIPVVLLNRLMGARSPLAGAGNEKPRGGEGTGGA